MRKNSFDQIERRRQPILLNGACHFQPCRAANFGPECVVE